MGNKEASINHLLFFQVVTCNVGNQGTGFHENDGMLQAITARHLLHRTLEGLGRIKKAGQNLSTK